MARIRAGRKRERGTDRKQCRRGGAVMAGGKEVAGVIG
jgi:hypothetical protein